MKKKTLLRELLDRKNLYVNDDDNFKLVKLYTNYLFFMIIISLIIVFALEILNQVTIFTNYFNYVDIISLTVGYTAFIYAFKLIKQKTIVYYGSNPLMLIAIIVPFFFNASLFNFIDFYVLKTNISGIIVAFVLVIVFYLILNAYYQKQEQKDE